MNNLVGNATAHVAAGAAYRASPSSQLVFQLSRGTTYAATDLLSSAALSVQF